jgi:hypothetical protein
VNIILSVYVCCVIEGSLLILPKLSRLHAWLDSIYHYTSVLFASIEVGRL